jgi:hypothetical protein
VPRRPSEGPVRPGEALKYPGQTAMPASVGGRGLVVGGSLTCCMQESLRGDGGISVAIVKAQFTAFQLGCDY